jgi:hypothetical protein
MFSTRSRSGSNDNPHGLSGPELNWANNGGRGNSVEESNEAKTARLTSRLQAAKNRVDHLVKHVQAGRGGLTEADVPKEGLDPEFTSGGKFALSAQEQQWASGGKPNTTETFDQQLSRKRADVASLQSQLNAMSG